ncbi:MAG: hypothetical protein ACLVGP_07295 [Oscillospiraceae bacterium]
MTSKKHWTLRAAGLLFALVLITSCFVGGTFAKYVTTGSGHESARVAKFGVTMSVANDKAFKQTYDTDNDSISGTISKSVEYSGNGDENLVAPGTKGSEPVVLSIKGTPEVAVNVKIAAEGHDVFLKAGEYPDLTTAAANETFTLVNDYHPITYTLTKTGEKDPVKKGNLKAITDYLNGLSKDYQAKTDLTSVIGEYKLSWEWKFEGGNDQADTLLGTLAALGPNSLGVNLENYSPQVLLKLTATVTQID